MGKFDCRGQMAREDFLRKAEEKKTMAQKADKHECYQKSVQDPRHEVTNLRNIYMELLPKKTSKKQTKGKTNGKNGEAKETMNEKDTKDTEGIMGNGDDREDNENCSESDDDNSDEKRQPLSLREDFCGTAILCEAWISKHVSRTAVGIDIDPSVIQYGQSKFKCDTGRIKLLVDDVMTAETEKVDILVALNYGVCYFQERKLLIEYLKRTKRFLNENGVFICDVFGGRRSLTENTCTIRDFGDFKYVFEQKSYNLMNNRVDCRLNFKFRDGSQLKDVFKYDFRLWTIGELREAVLESGYKNVNVWISETNRDDGMEDFVRAGERIAPMESFNAYIVGTMH